MNEQFSKEEKEKAYADFLIKQEKMYDTGRIIVVTIAIINMISAIASQFIRFNFFSLVIQIILSIMLIAGVSVVRYLFAIGAGLNVFLLLYLLFNFSEQGLSGGISLIIILLYIAFLTASAILLFASKSVGEFLYAQKNG